MVHCYSVSHLTEISGYVQVLAKCVKQTQGGEVLLSEKGSEI